MERLRIIAIVLITAILSSAVTSAFWLVAFNTGPVREAAPPPPPPVEPQRPELIVGPAGLAIPVAGVEVEELQDTYAQSRAGGARVHNAIDIMAPRGTPVIAAAPGTVEKLYNSQGGGGISAYVRSADGLWIYYYAHLDAYAAGLQEGQQLRQ
ncbi:M23 family metallopeptidase, partial [Allosphingosinicella sp.]|uniref:M23 family metallopeptidase n=1 Tax=Allosphingosinicella sp. TaxID=2823234 RepID=UPI002EDCD1F5